MELLKWTKNAKMHKPWIAMNCIKIQLWLGISMYFYIQGQHWSFWSTRVPIFARVGGGNLCSVEAVRRVRNGIARRLGWKQESSLLSLLHIKARWSAPRNSGMSVAKEPKQIPPLHGYQFCALYSTSVNQRKGKAGKATCSTCLTRPPWQYGTAALQEYGYPPASPSYRRATAGAAGEAESSWCAAESATLVNLQLNRIKAINSLQGLSEYRMRESLCAGRPALLCF